ncbi:hypothetical protein SAMN00790413_03383 [Deinococcus hopiensis KR-140]|uniref:Uncharacterized protein n=1 Tax=Deinococcus hopiensis KR-140 TaxID=695939 RepID=A0A1W1UWG3_9DEIO|nr:hypothetical protein SAMN00790413_03383 [Deinococcus hopiensis KR-140]
MGKAARCDARLGGRQAIPSLLHALKHLVPYQHRQAFAKAVMGTARVSLLHLSHDFKGRDRGITVLLLQRFDKFENFARVRHGEFLHLKGGAP